MLAAFVKRRRMVGTPPAAAGDGWRSTPIVECPVRKSLPAVSRATLISGLPGGHIDG